MAKVIAEKIIEAPVYEQGKQVEIKHTRIMQDASGKDVEVIDFVDVKSVEDAISQAEAQLASAEARVTELKADIVEYKKIKG